MLVRSSPFNPQLQSAEARCFSFFRIFLAIKIATPFIFFSELGSALPLSSLLACFGLLLALLPQLYRGGIFLLACLAGWQCYASWPFTINHGGLEFIALLLVCFDPGPGPREHAPSAAMIKLLMMSVWFYSGMHKLCDGYYLNGEFFALEVFAGLTPLGKHLADLLQALAPLFAGAADAGSGALQLTSCQAGVLLVASWLTIASELLLPLALFFTGTRTLALIALFGVQGMIAYFSAEIDFAFTAYGILLLFVPRISGWAYPLLSSVYLWDTLCK
jgi:hypothetical protein